MTPWLRFLARNWSALPMAMLLRCAAASRAALLGCAFWPLRRGSRAALLGCAFSAAPRLARCFRLLGCAFWPPQPLGLKSSPGSNPPGGTPRTGIYPQLAVTMLLATARVSQNSPNGRKRAANTMANTWAAAMATARATAHAKTNTKPRGLKSHLDEAYVHGSTRCIEMASGLPGNSRRGPH